ncbi:MAG: hypothetical protein GYB20_18700 [Oceanospirillales bacterium]|nr:hypothetical protein [Oceanospirillales bacterium]MBR9889715.1 hypothetical protein [Oceanospirillales bacterium]
MKIDNLRLHQFLIEKDITYFYHANSLVTASSFIRANGLLSRGCVEEKGFFQTAQSSDGIDKKYDVWNDVFIDTVDLHGHFPRQNLYGPVLFKFSIDILLKDEIDIWITKNNPIYWNEDTVNEDKYFQGVEELIQCWDSFDRQRKMFTIRKPGRPVLFESLEEIVLDNPNVKIYGEVDPFIEAKEALNQLTENKPKLRTLIVQRECNRCFCHDNYLKQVSPEQIARLFLPQAHSSFPK